MAEHGKAFLAMPSMYVDKKGICHSNIFPCFTQGDIITTPRTQAPYMVTEYGIANLVGLTTWQRAEKIISLAHPDFREGLIKAAEKQRIWRKSILATNIYGNELFLPIDVESERGYTFSVTASTRYRIESEPSPDTYYYLSKFIK